MALHPIPIPILQGVLQDATGSIVIDKWKEMLMQSFKDGEVYVVANDLTQNYEKKVKLFTSATIPMRVLGLR